MSIFGKLFHPAQNDAGTLLGHVTAFGALLLSTTDGQNLLAHAVGAINPAYAFMVPLFLAYLGGARAGQPPVAKPE